LRNLMMEVRAKESLTYDKKGKPKGGTLGSGVSA
ncbi:MAG TPA: flagellar biosynthesis protein FlgN, partial [Alteromonas macleodii]|nr:flagellar biosynthesis protein FlgN [Alteromonas macleodii]